MASSPRNDRRLPVVWRITIVMAGAVVIWGLMLAVSSAVFQAQVSPTSRIVNAAIVCGLAVSMVVAARRLLDHRPWSTLMLQSGAKAWRPFLIGVASFLVPSAIGLTVAILAGWVQIAVTVPAGDFILSIAFLIVMVFFFEALPEELVFRGYIFRNLSASIAPIAAVFVQAVLFAAFGTALWVVGGGWGVFAERAVMFLAVGVVLGLVRLVSASVWTPIGFHLAFQVVAQTAFGPDVRVDNALAFTSAGIVVAFIFATSITGWLSWRRPNWSRPEPDAELRPAEAS